MFNHNRAYLTHEQMSSTIKNNIVPLTCATRYSQYVRNARIMPNCTKIQRVYNARGQLIGKNMCIMKL